MDGTFDISIDRPRRLMRIRMAGFFDSGSLRRFLAARDEALAGLRCGAREHVSLTDIRDMQIQSQEMVAAFARVLADPSSQSKRLGLVVASTLARMQIRRALGDRIENGARIFTDLAEAERWVLQGDEGSIAA